jgi:purine-binding chemotaxis protein CheW
MEAKPYDQRTCIIVVEAGFHADSVLMGIVVDNVQEVVNLADEEIDDTPKFSQGMSTAYLLGMAKSAGTVKMLLDIDKALSSEDFSALVEIAKENAETEPGESNVN